MKKLFLALVMSAAALVNAQTLGSMPFTTPQITNPAFIGLNNQPQLNVFGRLGRNFGSSYAGYNQYSSKLKGTWGIFHNSLHSLNISDFDFNLNTVGLSYARVFNINDKWKYSLGASLQFSNTARIENAGLTSSQEIGLNLGGVLYASRFFTALNYSTSIQGIGQINWRTGYKLKPFAHTDFTITPMVTYSRLVVPGVSSGALEANLNLGYKKLNAIIGLHKFGYSLGVGYDFKRFRINYAINLNQLSFFNHAQHEFGIQFKLGKNKVKANPSGFNHRLF